MTTHRLGDRVRPDPPRSLTFEVTSRCNFRCRMCYYTEEHLGARHDALSLEDVRRCARALPESLETVYLIGGEPLLRRDIVEIAACFAARGVAPTVITNGYLLTEDLLQRFRAAGVRPTFEVSLDGPPRTHNAIRGRRDAFERTVENAARAHPEFPVIFTSVFQKDNIGTLTELPGLLRGFSGCLHVVQLAREWSRKDLEETGRALRVGGDADDAACCLTLEVREDAGVSPARMSVGTLLARLRELEAAGRRHGLRTRIKPAHLFETFPLLFGGHGNRHLDRFCCNQQRAVRLDAEGGVLFCYALRSPVGRLPEQPFPDIWGSEANSRLRATLARRLPPMCSQCTAHLDYQPPALAVAEPPFRLGLVGTGRIAGVYARAIRDIPGVILSGVCSHDASRAEVFASEHGRPGGVVASSPTALAAQSDAVLVAGSPGDRPDQVAAMPDTPLLLEKPLADTLEASLALAALDAASPGVARQMVFPLRHTVWAGAMGEFASDEHGGAAVFAALYRVTPLPPAYYADRPWRRGQAGSPLWNMLLHELDLLALWYGMPDTVTCLSQAVSHDVPYDTAWALLEYADGFRIEAGVSTSGAFAQGRAVLVRRREAAAHFVGDALFRLDVANGLPTLPEARGSCSDRVAALGDVVNVAPASAPPVMAGPMEDEEALCRLTLDRWLSRLRLGHAPSPTLLDGALRVALVDACHRSMRDGGCVSVPDIVSAQGRLP